MIISDKGYLTKNNEDSAFVGSNFAILVDGATGIGINNLIDGQTSASYFSNSLTNYFSENIDKLNSKFEKEFIKKFLSNAIIKIKEDYDKKIINMQNSDETYPSATLSLFLHDNEFAYFYWIGDSPINIEKKDGTFELLRDLTIPNLDNKIINKFSVFVKNGLNFNEAREKVELDLIEQRHLKNMNNGYWIASLDTLEWIDHINYKKLNLDSIKSIVLYSDGFFSADSLYHIYDLENNIPEEPEFKKILKKIRDVENNDIDVIKYPRLKIGDDATAVLIELEK